MLLNWLNYRRKNGDLFLTFFSKCVLMLNVKTLDYFCGFFAKMVSIFLFLKHLSFKLINMIEWNVIVENKENLNIFFIFFLQFLSNTFIFSFERVSTPVFSSKQLFQFFLDEMRSSITNRSIPVSQNRWQNQNLIYQWRDIWLLGCFCSYIDRGERGYKTGASLKFFKKLINKTQKVYTPLKSIPSSLVDFQRYESFVS